MILDPGEYAWVLRSDLTSFIERAFYELNPEGRLLLSPHVEVIATRLEACRQGKTKRLIIALPPRHLKSHCASVAFPAWVLGRNPATHIICASYGQELADKLARDSRRVMQSAWYQTLFATRLANRQVVHDFMTTAGGSRMATSTGGVLTGRGADLIIIDDAMKPEEALSETRRKAVNDWYDGTLLSRLNDKEHGCIIIIMQRLHQDDLVGHVLEQEGWEVLSFPAIAETDEEHLIKSPLGSRVFRRREGEALHPARESLTTLRTIRQTIGEYNFASQYQQNPTPVGGAMVKTGWLRYYSLRERPEHFSEIVQSWDTANKATELADYSVCTTWGVLGDSFFLLDVFRRRLDYPALRWKVVELARRHDAHSVVIEDRASGTQLIQDLQRELIGVRPYDPPSQTDKIMRLHTQTTAFENGFVLLPAEAPWLADYIAELTSFPGSRYDDQVDSTTQALDYMRQNGSLAVWEKLYSNGGMQAVDPNWWGWKLLKP